MTVQPEHKFTRLFDVIIFAKDASNIAENDLIWITQDDVKFKQAIRARNPEQRLRAFLHICQGKKECPYTNAPQPTYRLDGLKIMMEFPKPKGDEDAPPDTGDRKQVLA